VRCAEFQASLVLCLLVCLSVCLSVCLLDLMPSVPVLIGCDRAHLVHPCMCV